jgi:hypothetical protein
MSRLVIIGSVAAASAVLLTGTAAAVGIVAAKSQPVNTASSTSQTRVVAKAANVGNPTVDKAIKVANNKPKPLPKVTVKPIVGNNGGSSTGSKPRVVITYHTTKPTGGKKRVIIETITVTPTPSATSSHDHEGDHEGDHHGSNPSGTPTPGGGDD